MQVDNNLKQQILDFVVKSSHLGLLIDPKSDSSVSKVVQQLGFVGLQLYRRRFVVYFNLFSYIIFISLFLYIIFNVVVIYIYIGPIIALPISVSHPVK